MSAPMMRGTPPPSQGEPEYEVVGVPREGTLDLLFVGDAIWGVACHWILPPDAPPPGRSRRCTRDEDDCLLCGKHRKLWLGFAAVINLRLRRREVLRVGKDAAAAIMQRAGRVVSMRGLALSLKRVGVGATNGVTIEDTRCVIPDPIPQAHSCAATMRRVLGCERLPDYDVREDEVEIPDDLGGEGGVS